MNKKIELLIWVFGGLFLAFLICFWIAIIRNHNDQITRYKNLELQNKALIIENEKLKANADHIIAEVSQ
jgi:hypothetical protein